MPAPNYVTRQRQRFMQTPPGCLNLFCDPYRGEYVEDCDIVWWCPNLADLHRIRRRFALFDALHTAWREGDSLRELQYLDTALVVLRAIQDPHKPQPHDLSAARHEALREAIQNTRDTGNWYCCPGRLLISENMETPREVCRMAVGDVMDFSGYVRRTDDRVTTLDISPAEIETWIANFPALLKAKWSD